jgi:uncharacterized protein (DUF2141 family)
MKKQRVVVVGGGPGGLATAMNGIRPGVYALALLHDENENGRLDRNLVGIPEEGIGASNDAADRLGPPRFEDAKFEIVEGTNELPVRVRYWL